jgi:hypothetical protein
MVSDKTKAYNKQWKLNNNTYWKQYKLDNKEKIRKQQKQWRLDNREKIKDVSKQYKLDNTKQIAMKRWKKKGLNDDYDMVWNRYINSTNCENPKCNVVYGKIGDGTGTFKCMDHDHTPGLENNFRNILCSRCNLNLQTTNTSGTPNISKKGYGWRYRRAINGKTHSKHFKYYYDAIVYKYLFEAFNFY